MSDSPQLANIVDRLLGMLASFGFKEPWVQRNLEDAVFEIKKLRAAEEGAAK